MADALRDVRKILGPDALLLSTKEIPRRSGVWGNTSRYEVVAACDTSDNIDIVSTGISTFSEGNPRSGFTREQGEADQTDRLAETYSPAMIMKKAAASSSVKIKKTKKQDSGVPDDDTMDAVGGGNTHPFKGRIPLGMYHDLTGCGVDEQLACTMVMKAWEGLTAGQRRSRPALTRAVSQAALSMIAVPAASDGIPGKKIVAFVGPTGVGKTTSLAKLAAHLALEKRKKVVLVTLDGYRIGAIEQLRTYAGLMGIPFRFVPQVADLPRLIEENRQRDYILIDTAGRSPRDMDAMTRLSDYLRQSEQIERHLVLSAATKPSDMRIIVDRFEACGPDHLLFTKLDETSTPGPILNELVRTKKHFSYYTDGQKVPDDLHPVPGERILDIVLNRTENALKE
jgi:flagellar biosynthetic protein FlhF